MVVTICLAALVAHVTVICIQFAEHKVTANIEISSARSLDFPSVTVCNMNPIKKSALISESHLSEVLNDKTISRKKRAISDDVFIKTRWHRPVTLQNDTKGATRVVELKTLASLLGIKLTNKEESNEQILQLKKFEMKPKAMAPRRRRKRAGSILYIARFYLLSIRTVFIIHPCDPTVVICYLVWPCDTAVHITHLISHSSSLLLS